MDFNNYQKEFIYCASDPIYFLNNYGYVFDAHKQRVEKMTCFEYQEDCVYKFHKHRNNVVLKSRQTGLSVITAGYVAWRLMFRKDEKILIIANDGDGAIRFLSIVKQFINYTPKWLKPGKGNTVICNQKYVSLENNSYAQAKASSPEAGRGDSLTLLVLDETAFIENADTIWMAAGLALSATQGKCIMVSTPNGTSNLYYSIWSEAEKKENDFNSDDFVPTKVHWTQNPYCAEGLELRENESGEKTYWSPWYESECKRMQFDRVKISQELDLSFEGSKRLAIENELISKYEKRLLLDEYKLIEKNKTYYDYKNKPGERFVTYETNFVIYKPYVEGHKYIFGCLLPEEMVLTNDGLKEIQDVTFCDKLVDENGNYINVINKQIYDVVDEDVFEIKVDNTYRTTTFTKEHPILVSQNNKTKRLYDSATKKEGKRYWDFNFKYTKTENLKTGDWIKVPNTYKKELDININEKWCLNNNVRKDFVINSPIDNKNFWWFIGMWLGDGWIGKYKDSYSILLCFNKKEFFYVEKIEKIINELFNRTISITEKDSAYEITFNSKELYYFLLENFGQYSDGKKISEWVKYISKEYKLELIKGYFDSDGCWVETTKNNKKNSKISFISINLTLLESFQDILFSIGIISGIHKLRDAKIQIIKEREVCSKKCYSLNLFNFDSLMLVKLLNDKTDIKLNKFDISQFYNKNKRIISSCHFSNDEEFIYFKIKDIKKSKFTGKVYNFECDTHTFMCHHITTHNCDVARGDGTDYSTIEIIDIDTLEIAGEYRDKVAPDLFAHVIFNSAMDCGEAYLVVECNSFGLATAIDLNRKMNYGRMYYSKNIQEIYVRPYDYKVGENEVIPGFQTTKRTRPLVVNNLRVHLREGTLKIYSKHIMNEFRTFIQNGDRPEAERGKNDDLIFALAIGLFIRDTEYQNAAATKEMYKGMLDAIGYISKTIVGNDFSSNHTNENVSDIPPDAGGIFFNDLSKEQNNQDDSDDISWLLSPVKKT